MLQDVNRNSEGKNQNEEFGKKLYVS